MTICIHLFVAGLMLVWGGSDVAQKEYELAATRFTVAVYAIIVALYQLATILAERRQSDV